VAPFLRPTPRHLCCYQGNRSTRTFSTALKRSSLVVVLQIDWANYSARMSAPSTTPRTTSLLSRLRHSLEAQPYNSPTLVSLTTRFEPAIAHLDETSLERQRFATCETAASLAGYAAWSETKDAEPTRQNPAERVSKCMV
jgi:hypothetical protein